MIITTYKGLHFKPKLPKAINYALKLVVTRPAAVSHKRRNFPTKSSRRKVPWTFVHAIFHSLSSQT